jgi:NTP pyrophosphatase (non-canonical NTP hydrolase)
MMIKYEELQTKVYEWATEKGIFEKSTPIKQLGKTQEELDETLVALQALTAIDKQADRQVVASEALAEVEDGIGDMLVTIIILAKMVNLDSVACLESAYNVIKNRTGKMENGVFVKDN